MQEYVGLDVHKKFIFAVVLDGEGKVLREKKIKNEPWELDKFFKGVNKDVPIALESCSCWEYVYDYLVDSGFSEVVLATPSKIRLIATSRKKTDAHDARVIADLLRCNMLPRSYAPPSVIREQRLLTRHRISLGRQKSIVKNKIHSILIRNGINQDFDDIFSVQGINFLRSIDLSFIDRYKMDQNLELIRHFDVQIQKTENMIQDYVQHSPETKLIMTIPGISYYSGCTITGEIGDIRRFNDARKLTSFAGLNPSVSQSGNRCHTGRISKQGNKNIRWMLNQCANVAIMHDKTLAKIYHRIKKRKGHNIAITAVARKMLCCIYTMLTQNISYQALQIHKAKAS